MKFIIRKEQVAELAQPMLFKIKSDVKNHLLENFPDAFRGECSEEQISKLLDLHLQDARSIGFSRRADVYIYLIICMRFSTKRVQLLQNPQISAILKNAGLHPTEKLYLVDEILHKQ